MDPAKVSFLFGRVPTWADPDDPDDRSVLLREQGFVQEGAPGRFRLAMYEVVANQIADGKPIAVWETAERLLAMGLDRQRVLHNLALAVSAEIQASLGRDREFDVAAYVDALSRLPLPTGDEVEAAMVAIARDRQVIPVDELESQVMAELHMPSDTEPYRTLMDLVSDRAMDPDGPLALLAGDRVVHPESLLAGVVLTHRLTEGERAADRLEVGVDLAGFDRWDGPLTTKLGEELWLVYPEEGRPAWQGSEGWLHRFESGSLLAVRVGDDAVAVDALDDRDPDPALVSRIRSIYDKEVEGAGLPVHAEDILLGLLANDRDQFASAQAPISDLCLAAGLEIRGDVLAHEERVWENERLARRIHRIVDRLDDRNSSHAALGILEAFDEGTDDPGRLRRVLTDLRTPRVLEAVLDEMLGFDDDPEQVEETATFAERLLGVARKPSEISVARLVAAVASERRCDPLAGEAQLGLAVEADGSWGPAVDRLAWYRSDRGEAAEAAGLWGRLHLDPEHNADLLEVSGSPGIRAGGSGATSDAGADRAGSSSSVTLAIRPSSPSRTGPGGSAGRPPPTWSAAAGAPCPTSSTSRRPARAVTAMGTTCPGRWRTRS